jgi:hypothetical protein
MLRGAVKPAVRRLAGSRRDCSRNGPGGRSPGRSSTSLFWRPRPLFLVAVEEVGDRSPGQVLALASSPGTHPQRYIHGYYEGPRVKTLCEKTRQPPRTGSLRGCGNGVPFLDPSLHQPTCEPESISPGESTGGPRRRDQVRPSWRFSLDERPDVREIGGSRSARRLAGVDVDGAETARSTTPSPARDTRAGEPRHQANIDGPP